MSRQYFRELLEPIPLADLAAQTVGTTEVPLVTPAAANGLVTAANGYRAGQAFKLTIWGVTTTTATAVNWTITPRWGTTNGATSLGASLAVAKTAVAQTVPWVLQMWAVFRAVSPTASASTLVVGGSFESAAVSRDMVFGGTVATVDTTAAQGWFVGFVASATDTSSLTPRGVLLEALN